MAPIRPAPYPEIHRSSQTIPRIVEDHPFVNVPPQQSSVQLPRLLITNTHSLSLPLPTPAASPMTAPTMTAPTVTTTMLFAMLPLALELVLHEPTENGAANRAEKAVSLILPQVVSGHSATDRAEQAALTLGHGRGVGIVVGCILVAGLWRKLMGLTVGVVDLLRGPGLAILRLLRVLFLGLTAAVVSRLSLRVAGVVLAELSPGLSVLETTMLGRAKTIGSRWRTVVLIISSLLRGISDGRLLTAVALIWGLLLAILTIWWLVALLGRIATLRRRVALSVAGLLITWVVAGLAVLLVRG